MMRYAMPVTNTGDGKAALQQATTIADDEVNPKGNSLNDAIRNHKAHMQDNEPSEESYGYISSEASGGVKIIDNTEGRELEVERPNQGKPKRRSARDVGLMQVKVLFCSS